MADETTKVPVPHNGGDINTFTNCRPICILPVFPRGHVKTIRTSLTSFLNKRNGLRDFQFGFRKQMSTETALWQKKKYPEYIRQ